MKKRDLIRKIKALESAIVILQQEGYETAYDSRVFFDAKDAVEAALEQLKIGTGLPR